MRINNALWTAGNEIQSLAEELAEAKFQTDFADLPEEVRLTIYEQAVQVYREQE